MGNLDKPARLQERQKMLRFLYVREQLFAEVVQLLAYLVVRCNLIFICYLNGVVGRLQMLQFYTSDKCLTGSSVKK